MAKVKDLIGLRFGKLVVLERDFNAPKGHGAFWTCKCDCGNIVSIRGDSLRSGKTTSCGKTNKCSERAPRPVIDLTGKRFEKLTVVKRASEKLYKHTSGKQAVWECKCDCGNTTYVGGYELRNGGVKSCGCLKQKENVSREDLAGKRFGRLTVIEFDYESSDTKWICKCDCGNTVSVKASSLRGGNTKSCGCLQHDHPFNDLTGRRFGKLTVAGIDTYKTSQSYGITWVCECDCGNITSVQSSHLVSGSVHSCGCSTSSLGSLTIREYLDKHDIQYCTEYWFDDLRSDKDMPLRFDFYIPAYNICIEYDGRQHFEPIEYFGGVSSFERVQLHDAMKNKYCHDNNIGLLRISYLTSHDDIPNLLDKYIQESRNDHSLGSNDQAYAGDSISLLS